MARPGRGSPRAAAPEVRHEVGRGRAERHRRPAAIARGVRLDDEHQDVTLRAQGRRRGRIGKLADRRTAAWRRQ